MAASNQYNASIRRSTLKVALLEQLTNTKSVFRDVILRHCLRKRAKLLAQCDRSRYMCTRTYTIHTHSILKLCIMRVCLMYVHVYTCKYI